MHEVKALVVKILNVMGVLQDVDIFAKEFLFVPIHDHLHWSLLVICNPGADPSDLTRTSCMLHMDSLLGKHLLNLPMHGMAVPFSSHSHRDVLHLA